MKPAIAEKPGISPSSWVCVCPKGLRKVQCRHTQQGRECDHTEGHEALSSSDFPRLGSLCQVRVRLKEGPDMGQLDPSLSVTPDQPITELTQPTPLPRALDSVLQVPLGEWTVLRLGDGQCDITESCLEGMAARDIREILLTPVRYGSKASADPVLCPGTEDVEGLNAADQPLSAIVELHSFTPGRESWQVPPGEKWSWLRSHKERGGVRFRSGDVWGAADSYSRALKLLITLQQHTRETGGGMEDIKEEDEEEEEEEDQQAADSTQQPPSEAPLPTMAEYRSVKAELHSNLSLCQLKLHLPERARTNAAKAVLLEPGGAKAWYRLGQACLEVADLGEARRAFQRLLELQPDSTTAQKGLREVGNRERETNSQLGQRLSKMFS